MTYEERKIGEEFDFAGCITVHKSQGSQFKSVLLYDDRFLRNDTNMRKRWLYTAATRAVDEFCWAD
jgi:exodeoxyribonuclease-5